jgi:hypothetical protein
MALVDVASCCCARDQLEKADRQRTLSAWCRPPGRPGQRRCSLAAPIVDASDRRCPNPGQTPGRRQLAERLQPKKKPTEVTIGGVHYDLSSQTVRLNGGAVLHRRSGGRDRLAGGLASGAWASGFATRRRWRRGDRARHMIIDSSRVMNCYNHEGFAMKPAPGLI